MRAILLTALAGISMLTLFSACAADSGEDVGSDTAAVSGPATGLEGDYFSDAAFGKLVTSRTDTTVNFDWGTGSPASGVPVDGFSVRWTGQVTPLHSETYTFYTISDDGIRVWVNGVKVIDNFTDHAATENHGTIALSAGKKYDIKIEYYEHGGNAVAKLSWSSASQAKQIIPTSQLSPPPPPPTGFVHPGVLLGKSQLDFVKGKIAAGAQPWAGAYSRMTTSGTGTGGKFSSLTYTPSPVPSVQCVGASGDHTLDIGCEQQRDDAIAAYADALIWYYTGNSAYADHAIAIMNAWSSTLKEIKFDTTYTNGLLQAGWTAEEIVRAAEIIRHTYTGWKAADVARFTTMLKTIFLPNVNHGWTGGGANWLMTFSDATINIGVFTDDKTTFDLGVSQWQSWIKSIGFMSTDVNPYPQLAGYPIPPTQTIYDKATITPAKMNAYWHDPPAYHDGLEGETCRDMSHTAMGLSSATYAAETARIQGVDLIGQQKARLVAMYEFNAKYDVQAVAHLNAGKTAGTVGDDVCGGSLNTGGVGYELGFEAGYNALAGRLGVSMPNTKQLIDTVTRPGSYKAGNQMAWEELTFAFE